MQTYAPTSTNHQRSLSLCNYDELCSIRKREIVKQMDSVGSNDNEEQCLLTDQENRPNYTEPCNRRLNCDKVNTESYLTSADKSNITSLAINDYCDESMRIFTCSSKKNKHNSDGTIYEKAEADPIPSVNIIKGHRRSLSLRHQFEVGYDYLITEFGHAKEFAGKTVTQATKTVTQATGAVWKVCHFSHLPKWMQDNEFLHTGHRPPLPTFWECIKSIFRLHTETGNIWTHGLGSLLFVGLFIYEFVTISAHKTAIDRLMLTIYFCGIILCLFFSFMFHTFSCYASPKVIKIFSKLDYCGISLQIIGSMTPALYYGFYEDFDMFKLYISFGVVLCIISIAVSMWDKFGEPKYRSFRAMVFLCFGLSNVIPGVHWYIILDSRLLTAYYLFILQGALYVIGSLLYANRIPERLFPGKCDYMFQSHQIFHVLVVLAAFVHLNGINSMAEFRLHHRLNLIADISSSNSSLF
ncbi:Adiponectin receptor protein [Sarcoptes scabiei]|uniref:Adiponectin receptor protein n=1 Tax=Sarcoptes scabiei TaxID=52283 RepID=A0A834REM5_SARSC|nr:Adiponectin receptor protein [Sarcoptes scabiei]